MTRILRSALMTAVTLGLVSTAACKTVCKEGESGTNCVAQTTTQYTGTPKTQTIQIDNASVPLAINVEGGNVRVGNASTSITINPKAAANTIQVTFTPFNSDTEENKQKAIDQMNNNLVLTATGGPSAAISVKRTGTFNSSLSAMVDILIPPDFAGSISAITSSGDVSINGAKAGVTTSSGLGNIAVIFNGPTKTSDTGSVTTKQGDITFDLDAKSDLSMTVVSGSDGAIYVPNPLPAGWAEGAGSTPQAASYTGNMGSAAAWKLDASGFFTSKVSVKLHLPGRSEPYAPVLAYAGAGALVFGGTARASGVARAGRGRSTAATVDPCSSGTRTSSRFSSRRRAAARRSSRSASAASRSRRGGRSRSASARGSTSPSTIRRG